MARMPLMPGAPAVARRQLRKQEMVRFGSAIEWLADPTIIPEDVLEYSAMTLDPYMNVAVWMIDELVRWSGKAHRQLDYKGVFNHHDLLTDDRARVKTAIRDHASNAFSPGIGAFAEIYGVVPPLVARAGLSVDQRGATAQRARPFGVILAQGPSPVQALVRKYLAPDTVVNAAGHFDPARLKLDEKTGITTVTPLPNLLKVARCMLDEAGVASEGHSGKCVALQAPIEELGGVTMFDACWQAFGVVTNRFIYPEIDLSAADVPAQERVDRNVRAQMADIIITKFATS